MKDFGANRFFKYEPETLACSILWFCNVFAVQKAYLITCLWTHHIYQTAILATVFFGFFWVNHEDRSFWNAEGMSYSWYQAEKSCTDITKILVRYWISQLRELWEQWFQIYFSGRPPWQNYCSTRCWTRCGMHICERCLWWGCFTEVELAGCGTWNLLVNRPCFTILSNFWLSLIV